MIEYQKKRGGGNMVEKENLRYKFKRNVGKKIVVLAKKIATSEINASCPLFAYQPKLPKGSEKLRKY